MKIRTPLTRAKLRTHITYYFWAYLLIVAGSIFAWNLLYTVSAYRSPEDKRIDIYMQAPYVSTEIAQAFVKPIWDERVPDTETVETIMLSGDSQDYYTGMQLTVYLMSQEGDIYLLSSADFKTYASQGFFLDLSPFVADGRLNTEGIDLSAGYVALTDENGLPVGERKLFGIPLSSLYGYMNGMGLDNRDLIACVTVYNGNEENVIKFLDGFLEAGHGEKPEGLL